MRCDGFDTTRPKNPCGGHAVEFHVFAEVTDGRTGKSIGGTTFLLCDNCATASKEFDVNFNSRRRDAGYPEAPLLYCRLHDPATMSQHDIVCVEVMCHAFGGLC